MSPFGIHSDSDQISFRQLAFGHGTPRKALVTALLVGTVLTAINHGDTLIAGEAPSFAKLALTYIVPYCVATWGAVTGKRAASPRAAAGLIDPASRP